MNSLRLLSRNVHNVARMNVQARSFQSSARFLNGQVNDASDETFQKLISVKETVIVDFHADWCRPCHMLDPIIRDAVKSTSGTTLVRVDVDECPQTAAKYSIASIPAVFALKNGDIAGKFVGALPKNAVKEFVESHANKA
ncbi:thioredoxin-like protein [Linnemannia elongata AG-77]|uniref:Thioredoxin-like protein n=1 Tax=Linnemannia elongata AG-77 TaxID=1314771 RepID=A0A197JZD8_9FUNG|nr:thioredoxin-like protein [Linnemannia elongata AG-77]